MQLNLNSLTSRNAILLFTFLLAAALILLTIVNLGLLPFQAKSITAQERTYLLHPPTDTFSEEDLENYFVVYDRAAKETNTIVIANCEPDPLAVKVKKSQPVIIENKDESAHIIKVLVAEGTKDYPVQAKNRTRITLDAERYPHFVTYRCDSSPDIVGLILITN